MTAGQPVVSQDRLTALDGLRGAMAYWVLLGHVFGQTGMHWVPVLASPKYAVNGFMLLSGFLMTWHYVKRASKEPWTSWRTWCAFYVRRFLRISPLYYLLLIPTYLLLGKYRIWHGVRAQDPGLFVPLSWQHVLSHITYVYGMLPRYCASLPIPDWSISLEMQFYLAFPFLMLLVLRFGWPVFCILSGLIWYVAGLPGLGLTQAFDQPSLLFLSLIWFAIGMVWAGRYALDHKPHIPSILMGFLLVFFSRDLHDIILVIALGFVLFVGDVPVIGKVAALCRRALSCRLAEFMADASYSVYLVHLLILRPLAYYLLTSTRLTPNQRGIVALALTTTGSYLFAVLLRPVESWGISVGRKLAKTISGSVPIVGPHASISQPAVEQAPA